MHHTWGAPGLTTLCLCMASCGGSGSPGATLRSPSQPQTTTFADDVAFLEQNGAVLVLESPTGARVAVSPHYQGRVMTSAVEPNGRSLGSIFRKFIQEGKTGTSFDNYGGEDRFWLGPEGGQFGLYFPPGKPFTFANWQTPNAFQAGDWLVRSHDATSVTFERSMAFTNHAGTAFRLNALRTVRLLGEDEMARKLGVDVHGAKAVAFQSENRITNTGPVPWTEDKGLVSIWILAMFPPAADTFVVVPFDKSATGPIVNDSYFGKVPSDRLSINEINEKEGYLVFRCDGKHRSKIGLRPRRARQELEVIAPPQGY